MLTCEAQGHEFTLWRRLVGCRDEALVLVGDETQTEAESGGGVVGGDTRVYRYCRRCCLHESRRSTLFDCVVGGLVGGRPAAKRALPTEVAESGEVA